MVAVAARAVLSGPNRHSPLTSNISWFTDKLIDSIKFWQALTDASHAVPATAQDIELLYLSNVAFVQV